MSDTPRTSEEWRRIQRLPDGRYSSQVTYEDLAHGMCNFAKQLERELAEAREQRNALAEALEDIASRRLNDHMGPHDMSLCCVTLAQAALAAVKGGKHD